MEFSRPEYWSGQPFSPPGDIPNPGTEPRSPTLQVDSLPAEPQGKPKNTGVDSLSLLQRIFPIQESDWGLLHCRWILYQLSHKGSPKHPELLLNDRHLISPPLLWHKLDENDGEGNGTLQYSCLGNPVDRGAWRAQSMGSVQEYRRNLVTKQWQRRVRYRRQILIIKTLLFELTPSFLQPECPVSRGQSQQLRTFLPN